MDFLQLVQARQSDRSYDKERPVEPEKLERILEAARLAPSACNAQPWKFVVITDKELAQKAGKAAAGLGMNKFAKDAPVHILVVEESANITPGRAGDLFWQLTHNQHRQIGVADHARGVRTQQMS